MYLMYIPGDFLNRLRQGIMHSGTPKTCLTIGLPSYQRCWYVWFCQIYRI